MANYSDPDYKYLAKLEKLTTEYKKIDIQFVQKLSFFNTGYSMEIKQDPKYSL